MKFSNDVATITLSPLLGDLLYSDDVVTMTQSITTLNTVCDYIVSLVSPLSHKKVAVQLGDY